MCSVSSCDNTASHLTSLRVCTLTCHHVMSILASYRTFHATATQVDQIDNVMQFSSWFAHSLVVVARARRVRAPIGLAASSLEHLAYSPHPTQVASAPFVGPTKDVSCLFTNVHRAPRRFNVSKVFYYASDYPNLRTRLIASW